MTLTVRGQLAVAVSSPQLSAASIVSLAGETTAPRGELIQSDKAATKLDLVHRKRDRGSLH